MNGSLTITNAPEDERSRFSLASENMTVLAARVLPDRVLLAADGRSLTSRPGFPFSTERTIKFVEVPGHLDLMVGITGPSGNLFDYRDALAAHPLATWHDVTQVGREELISMNNAVQDRAQRANIERQHWPEQSSALVAGIVAGRPGAVKFVNDGTAPRVEEGPCFVGGLAHMMAALLSFAETMTGSPIATSDRLSTFLEAAEGVYPDILLPIDTWEISLPK